MATADEREVSKTVARANFRHWWECVRVYVCKNECAEKKMGNGFTDAFKHDCVEFLRVGESTRDFGLGLPSRRGIL